MGQEIEVFEDESVDNKNNLTNWKKEPKFEDLYADYQAAQEDHSLVLDKLETYKENMSGGPKINSPKGKSKVRPKLIRKQAEWKYPALEEPFLNTDDMFDIRARTFEDVKSAEQNALVINYQWSVKIDKIAFVGDAVRTIVDEGTVIVKTGWESEEGIELVEKEVPVYASAEESMMMMQQAVQEGKMSQEQMQQALMSGQPMQIGVKYEEVEETVLIKNQPAYEVCDTRNVILDPTANGDPSLLNFVIHEYETDMSTLLKQEYITTEEFDEETGETIKTSTGVYHNLDKIKVSGKTDTREYYNDTELNETNFEFKDKARKKLRAYEYWGYWDIDDSGETTMIVATWIDKVMIRMEKSPFPFNELPFSIAKYMPVKNEMHGEPDGALLIENQDSIGKMTRAAHDITSDIAVGQEFIDEQFFAGPSQKDNYRSGKTVYFRHGMDPRQSIHKQSIDSVPKTVFDMISLQNNDAESLSGTKSFSQGIGSQALGSVATGIRSALDATAKRELSILRRLAEQLFKDIGRKTIMMNQAFLEAKEVVRITNSEFVTINREDLTGEFDLKINVSTPERDNEKAEKLNTLMQTNAASMDPNLSKIIYSRMAKLWKEPDLAKEIESYEPQPDPVGEEIKQLQLQNARLENQKLQMEIAKMAKDIESEDSKITERESRTAQNLDSESAENQANARFKNAQAAKLEEETDSLKQDFLRKYDGLDRKEYKEDKEAEWFMQHQRESASGNRKQIADERKYNADETKQDLDYLNTMDAKDLDHQSKMEQLREQKRELKREHRQDMMSGSRKPRQNIGG